MRHRVLLFLTAILFAANALAQLETLQNSANGVMVAVTPGDDKGSTYKALGREGAGPGGHHRKGVLKFNTITPRPRAVGLRISRPGEAKARTFRWELE